MRMLLIATNCTTGERYCFYTQVRIESSGNLYISYCDFKNAIPGCIGKKYKIHTRSWINIEVRQGEVK